MAEERKERKSEVKTEKILKWYRMRDRQGKNYRFEAMNYEAAQNWANKQLQASGLVYPKDLALLAEEN